MPTDLTLELANLNDRARQLLEVYENSFNRLGQKSQEYAQQLADQIQNYLSQLQTAKDDALADITNSLNNAISQLNAILESGAFTRVVSIPTITGLNTASIGYSTSWQVSAESYLDENVSIDKFIVDWGDGNTEEIPATSNTATITHTYTGAEGETKTISVIAVDTLGNKSKPATLQVSLVNNQPPTSPTINAPDNVLSGKDFTITISGSTNPEGGIVTYKIIDSPDFTFSKTENIQDNEEITVTPPTVDTDTTFQIKAVAIDEQGLQSDVSAINILVRYVAPSGSITFSTPGNYSWTVPEGVYAVTVEALGAGGGGGCSGAGSGGAGGDGGYGKTTLSVVPGETYTVIIGAGGQGGEYTSNGSNGVYGGRGDGWHGGDTYFMKGAQYIIKAYGGKAGHGGNSSPANEGGDGGIAEVFAGSNIITQTGAKGCNNCGACSADYRNSKPPSGKGGRAACAGTPAYAEDGGDGLVTISW